jgi:GNAT superfamily N-acetyltransferase
MKNITYQMFSSLLSDKSSGKRALGAVMEKENPTKSYSRIIRKRLSGMFAEECNDYYYVALDDNGDCISRLCWSWGTHADSVGNWGNFQTREDFQGKGVGRNVIQLFIDHLQRESSPPLALFCTCGSESLTKYYSKLGFRPAIAGTTFGPLYCPLGDTPPTFAEFCRNYYTPSDHVIRCLGTAGYRHEIDCLLKFALLAKGLPFGLPSVKTYEDAVLLLLNDPTAGTLERFALPNGHTVGWAYTPRNGQTEIQLHPDYSFK